MSSVLTTLGLRAATADGAIPNHAAAYILVNWALAYQVFSSRITKRIHGLDHNAAPREDVAKYGEAAVQSGKISRRALDMIKRNEAAHANSLEAFPLFVAGVLLAVHAGVPSETINGIGAWFTLSRIAFGVAYILTESEAGSFIRSAAWWSGNASCFTALVMAAKRL